MLFVYVDNVSQFYWLYWKVALVWRKSVSVGLLPVAGGMVAECHSSLPLWLCGRHRSWTVCLAAIGVFSFPLIPWWYVRCKSGVDGVLYGVSKFVGSTTWCQCQWVQLLSKETPSLLWAVVTYHSLYITVSQSCCGAVVVRREYLIAKFSCHRVTVVSLSR